VAGLVPIAAIAQRSVCARVENPGGGCDWRPALESAWKILAQSQRPERDIVILTDGQRHGWAEECRTKPVETLWLADDLGDRFAAGSGQHQPAQHCAEQSERDGDEEHPLPAQRVDQQPADRRRSDIAAQRILAQAQREAHAHVARRTGEARTQLDGVGAALLLSGVLHDLKAQLPLPRHRRRREVRIVQVDARQPADADCARHLLRGHVASNGRQAASRVQTVFRVVFLRLRLVHPFDDEDAGVVNSALTVEKDDVVDSLGLEIEDRAADRRTRRAPAPNRRQWLLKWPFARRPGASGCA